MLRLCRRATAVLALTALFPTIAVAQSSRAGIVTTLEGTVTARRVANPQPVALKFKDDIFMQDRIVTAEKSLARLLLGDKAIVTVRERSVFTVSETPGRSTVGVESGKIGLAVAKDRMRPGEQIEIRTPGAIVAVRGTVVVVDVPDGGDAGGAALPASVARPGGQAVAQATGTPPAESIFVLRGAVEARVRTSPSGPLGPTVMVNAFQVLTVRSGVGTVNAFSPQQVSGIIAGLRASAPQFKEGANAAETKATAQQTTQALVQALVGPAPGGNGPRPVGPEPKDGPRADGPPQGPTGLMMPPLIPDFTTEDIATVSGGLQVSGFRFLPPGVQLATFSGTSSRDGTAPYVNVMQADLIQGGADDLISVSPGALATLGGPLAQVRGSNVVTGGHFLDVSGTIQGTGGESFLSFNPSTIYSPTSLIRVGSGGRLAVASPLLSDVGSTFIVGADFLSVAGELTVSSPLAALHLVDSTVLAGGAAGAGGGGSFFSLSGPSARATLAGPALAAIGGSFTFIGTSVVRIDNGAQLVGLSPLPFAIMQGVATSIDNSQAGFAFANSSTSLAGGLFDANNVLDLGAGGGGTSSPLIGVVGASLSTGNALLNMTDTAFDFTDSHVLAMSGSTVAVGGPLVRLFNSRLDTLELLGMDPTSTLTLTGGIAEMANSTLTSIMDLVPVKNGARIISTSAGALLPVNTSTLAVGDAILGLRGRAGQTASEVANGVTLTLGTDQPITHASVWLDAVNSTVTAKHAVALDTALLDASAPLLSLRAGTAMTTSLDAINLTGQAKLTSLGPLVALDAGQLTVNSGAVLNVANGSLVRVTGDLFVLSNGSLLRATSGPLVRVSGNSVLNVTGAFIAFGGSGANQVTVSNSICGTSCITAGGIPVHFINGASLSNVTIGMNPIKNQGLGSFSPMGPAAAAILLDGPNSKVNITAP